MLQYAQFVGQWNDQYGNYRWHKLRGGDVTALGDCLATLDLIRDGISCAAQALVRVLGRQVTSPQVFVEEMIDSEAI